MYIYAFNVIDTIISYFLKIHYVLLIGSHIVDLLKYYCNQFENHLSFSISYQV